MDWIYYDPERKWLNTHSRTLYLRKANQKGQRKRKPSGIILMKIYAMDYFFGLSNNPFKSSDYQSIYHEELTQKPIFVRENVLENVQEKYLQHSLVVYLKTHAFLDKELLKWCRAVLVERSEHVTSMKSVEIEFFQEIIANQQNNGNLLKRITRLFS